MQGMQSASGRYEREQHFDEYLDIGCGVVHVATLTWPDRGVVAAPVMDDDPVAFADTTKYLSI